MLSWASVREVAWLEDAGHGYGHDVWGEGVGYLVGVVEVVGVDGQR
jgi:hypothetical protein